MKCLGCTMAYFRCIQYCMFGMKNEGSTEELPRPFSITVFQCLIHFLYLLDGKGIHLNFSKKMRKIRGFAAIIKHKDAMLFLEK